MFDTIICETKSEQFNFYKQHYSDSYNVIATNDINFSNQVVSANGAVFVKGGQFLDLLNLSKRNLKVSTKIYGLIGTCGDFYQDYLYPNSDTSKCADWAVYSGCFFIDTNDCPKINSLDCLNNLNLKESHIEVFNSKLFKLIEYKNALFLDRDGIINVDTGYTHKVDDLILVDGVVDFLQSIQNKFNYFLVVTNQAGIARGLYNESAVTLFHTEINKILVSHSVKIDAFELCPYHIDGNVLEFSKHSFFRKPFAGMVYKHAYNFAIDLSASLMIGDRASDVLKDSLLSYAIINSRYIDLSKIDFKVYDDFLELRNNLIL